MVGYRKRVALTLTCDVCGSTTSVESLVLAAGTSGWLIDLCPTHRQARVDAVTAVAATRARPVDLPELARIQAVGRPPVRRPFKAAEGVSMTDVREWARTEGLPVPATGRVSAELVEAYKTAHRNKR